ncbi:hypothetical protein HF086_015288 [Spodoptera exigua]|uniref:DIX domain-containing protein n=1 Tax=Spodoptera exigua TaxID=7107 RepID=A0A922M8D2_SPOEX|nr:hypothetical protein HF086_015288 [Spodoptera exigua]
MDIDVDITHKKNLVSILSPDLIPWYHFPIPGGSRHRKRSVYSAHVSYAGYCPASRQDSERASLSSGRTDSDAISLSGSSVDGMSVRNVREPRESRHRPRLHGLDRHAVINKEQDTAMVIPRTARVQSEQLRVLPPAEFAPLLIEKLERVRRDQEAKERLERRLAEGDVDEASNQHVSRVWSERTPGASPPGGRRARPRHHGAHGPHPARRAPSALSADSGHYDAPPDSLHHPHSLTRSYSGRSFSKKTVTELTDSGVSVVSEGGVEPRILLWMAEGERLDRLERGDRPDRSDRPDRPDRLERRHHSRASSADRDDLRRKDKPPRAARGGGSKSSSTSGGAAESHTVVVVTFLDENVPYRYFFKTNCADLDTVIQEEVSSDSDTLPMFEGKVMARVKSID